MKEGDVVLAYIPQADGGHKRRPAIFLREMPRYRDLLVCGVSSQLGHEVSGFDEIISQANADFKRSGLLCDSLIRLGFLCVLPRKHVLGSIGSISAERHARLVVRLSNYIAHC